MFVLLAGVSAGLMRERKGRHALARFLLTRGVWLVAVEMFVISTLVTFSPRGIQEAGAAVVVPMQVIWAIGASDRARGTAVSGPHDLPGDRRRDRGGPQSPRRFLAEERPVRSAVAALGRAACADVVAAAIERGAATAIDFLTTKYPPSLRFLLMTLGPAAIVCAFADRWTGGIKNALVTFGRVPFAFYVAHIFLIHVIALGLGMLQGFAARQLITAFLYFPKGYGVELPLVRHLGSGRDSAVPVLPAGGGGQDPAPRLVAQLHLTE